MLWVGSENFSVASLCANRELGIVLKGPRDVEEARQAFDTDFAGGEPLRTEGAS